MRRVIEDGPEDWIKSAEDGSYKLLYFGRHQHAYKFVELGEVSEFRMEIIDTWNMTITPVEGTYRGRTKVKLPGKPYIALRMIKV